MFFGVIYSCNQEISVSPPDAPPPHGNVLIDSKPPGAHIFLDGKDRRRITPDSLTWLETNTYTITLKKELYRDTSITIEAREGEKKNYFVDYTLNPAMRGKINCNAKPDGAEIFLDGVSTGKFTPTVLTAILPGYYNIRYHSANFRDDSLTVTVSSSNITEAKTTLVDTTKWTDFTTKTSGIQTNLLTGLTIDKDDNLWIATEDQGVIKYNSSTWQLVGGPLLQDIHVTAINVADDGAMWSGNKFGLFVIYADGSMARYNDISYGTILSEYSIVDINRGYPGYEIIATPNTILLTHIDELTGSRVFGLSDKSTYGVSGNFTAVAGDASGGLYLGTSQTGLFISGAQGGIFNTGNSAIIGNNVSAVTYDGINGGVWVGFKSAVAVGAGLSYFNNGSFESYYVLPNGGSANKIFVEQGGKKWVGTNAGLVSFNSRSDAILYNKETTGLDINDVRGIVQDKLGRIWIAAYGGGLILKKK